MTALQTGFFRWRAGQYVRIQDIFDAIQEAHAGANTRFLCRCWEQAGTFRMVKAAAVHPQLQDGIGQTAFGSRGNPACDEAKHHDDARVVHKS